MKRSLYALVASVSLFALDPAYGQSNPGFYYNFVPTAGQWNSYFSGKADFPGILNNPQTWTGVQTFNSIVTTGSATLAPGVLTTPTAISGLPVCDNNAAGMRAAINNGLASPTYHQSVGSTGSTFQPVFCAGLAGGWIYD